VGICYAIQAQLNPTIELLLANLDH